MGGTVLGRYSVPVRPYRPTTAPRRALLSCVLVGAALLCGGCSIGVPVGSLWGDKSDGPAVTGRRAVPGQAAVATW